MMTVCGFTMEFNLKPHFSYLVGIYGTYSANIYTYFDRFTYIWYILLLISFLMIYIFWLFFVEGSFFNKMPI